MRRSSEGGRSQIIVIDSGKVETERSNKMKYRKHYAGLSLTLACSDSERRLVWPTGVPLADIEYKREFLVIRLDCLGLACTYLGVSHAEKSAG